MLDWGAFSIALFDANTGKFLPESILYDLVQRDNLINSLALFHDGSQAWTADQHAANHSLLSIATLIFHAGTGTGADLNGKDIVDVGTGTFDDLVCNNSLSGPILVLGDATTATKGTTTASGSGVLTDDSADSLDFTELTANTHAVNIPADSAQSVMPIDAITDSNNVVLANATDKGPGGISVSNATAYSIYDVGNASFQKIGEVTFSAGSTGDHAFSLDDDEAGVKRRLIMVNEVFSNVADTYNITYGDATYNDWATNGTNKCYFKIKSGTNSITINKTGTNGASQFDVYVEEMRELGFV